MTMEPPARGPDEPSNGELARRLDKIEVLLQGLVSRAEYTTDQRHMEHRFGELDRDISELHRVHQDDIAELRRVHQEDIADVRRVHTEDHKEVKKKMEDERTTSGSNFRQGLYNGVLPGIFLLVGLLVTILLAFKGGK